MYTAQKTELGRLKAYSSELAKRYCIALERRDIADARRIFDLRHRVQRIIRLAEEFGSVERALQVAATVTPQPGAAGGAMNRAEGTIHRAPTAHPGAQDRELPAVLRHAAAIAAAAGL